MPGDEFKLRIPGLLVLAAVWVMLGGVIGVGSFGQIYPLTDKDGWKNPAGIAAAGFGACLVGLLVLEPWSWFPRARPRRSTLTTVTTIEEYERNVWPDPGPDATSLVRRCAELRRKPVADFTVEDLRVLLGQEIGVPALLPRAVAVLLRDPLAEGAYHPGDLLSNVLRLRDAAWSDLQTERTQLAAVLTELIARPPFSDPDLKPAHPDRLLRDAVMRFLGR
ncbi:contact-dependent growth inhibition system immunity protein [Micromonospora mangrovi]|uniref:Contact-dependent growth inhibition system immunity protein n=2 Tax=Micromonospora TaxID=1873 RepID=A0AAU8H8G6_9ACTN